MIAVTSNATRVTPSTRPMASRRSWASSLGAPVDGASDEAVPWSGGAVTLRKSTYTQVTAVREANDAGFRLVGPAISAG